MNEKQISPNSRCNKTPYLQLGQIYPYDRPNMTLEPPLLALLRRGSRTTSTKLRLGLAAVPIASCTRGPDGLPSEGAGPISTTIRGCLTMPSQEM